MKKFGRVPDPAHRPAYKLKETKPIDDPTYKPSYKLKETKPIDDPTYKPPYKLKVFTSVPDPTYKIKSKNVGMIRSLINIFTPSSEKSKPLASSVDANSVDVVLPSVSKVVPVSAKVAHEVNAKVVHEVSAKVDHEVSVKHVPKMPPKMSIPFLVPKIQKVMPKIVPIEDVKISIPEPAIGSREWKKKQFKATNFI